MACTETTLYNKLSSHEPTIQPKANTWSVVNKGVIIWLLVKVCLRDTAGSPEWARCCSGSQSQHAIWFILPAHKASHIPVITRNFNMKVSAGLKA